MIPVRLRIKVREDGVSGISSWCTRGKVARRSETSARDKVVYWKPVSLRLHDKNGKNKFCVAREFSRT